MRQVETDPKKITGDFGVALIKQRGEVREYPLSADEAAAIADYRRSFPVGDVGEGGAK